MKGSEPLLTVGIESRDGVTKMGLSGELDLSTAPILQQQLDGAEDGHAVVILDLRDLSFMDCSGLRVVLDALDRAEANGQRLVLVGAGSRVLRLFEVLRMEHLLTEDDDGGAGHSVWDGDGHPSHREARGFPNG